MKWILFFIFSFAVAWIVIITFSQVKFGMTVPAIIFTWETPPIPIYVYLVGAFSGGFGIGVVIMLYYYFITVRKKNRRIDQLRDQIDSLRAAAPETDDGTDATLIEDREDIPQALAEHSDEGNEEEEKEEKAPEPVESEMDENGKPDEQRE
jgi:hypothetical protein